MNDNIDAGEIADAILDAAGDAPVMALLTALTSVIGQIAFAQGASASALLDAMKSGAEAACLALADAEGAA